MKTITRAKKIGITLPGWVLDEMVGESENRSDRIQELIVKGYMAEKSKTIKKRHSGAEVYLETQLFHSQPTHGINTNLLIA